MQQLSLFQKARELPHKRVRVMAFSGESHIVHFLIGALSACILAYLYFVSLSIMNVISNREATVESQRLQSVVGNLEEEYFELSKRVTLQSGEHLGLSTVSQTSFVRRATGMASNATANEI